MAAAEAQSYRTYQIVDAIVRSPLEQSDAEARRKISAYPYYRSRLLVPGRSYEEEEYGPLGLGGSAHCDVMDLDAWLVYQDDRTRVEVYDWTLDSSQEDVAYWRSVARGKSISQQAISKRRARIAEKVVTEGVNPSG